MKFHIVVNIHAGRNIKTSVDAYSKAVKPRTIKFANGRTITDRQVAAWIAEQVLIALEKIEDGADE